MTPIFVNGKRIGKEDKKNKVFYKEVRKSKHLFRVLDAWGIDEDYLTHTLLPENYTIEVYDVEEQVRYRASAQKIKSEGQYFQFKNQNIDHRRQLFLKRSLWEQIRESDRLLEMAMR